MARFDAPFASTGTWRDNEVKPGSMAGSGGEGYATGADRAGRGSGGWVGFDTTRDRTVTARIGISYVSEEGAEHNLRSEIPRGQSVDKLAATARADWNRSLALIRTAGGSAESHTVFTTAMYHVLQQPNVVSDVNGQYLGMDRQIHRLARGQRAQYSDFSGWDQYRAQVQLMALTEPRLAGDFAQSLYNYARQNGGVWDRWVHVNGATHVMTGDPSAITLASIYAWGVRNFDVRGAFTSLVKQATVPVPASLSDAGCPGQCEGQRPGLAAYETLHYAPQDKCHCWGGAAETLEDSAADAALSSWAAQLGDVATSRQFAVRAQYWRNTWDPDATPEAGYFRPRNADGSWSGTFDPASDLGFAQGSAAAYVWMVPQDVSGLADLMGGRDAAAARLDGFFHNPDGSWSLSGGGPLHYDPTNEPDIHAPWLYNALGKPWKTQETVRALASTVYTTGPSGLPGNDDLGTMSAWYIWAALGLFPQAPARADLLVSSPIFPHAVVFRDGRKTLAVSANAQRDGTTSTYVSGLRVNGRIHAQSWIPAAMVLHGARIQTRLQQTPDTDWATDPSSLPRD